MAMFRGHIIGGLFAYAAAVFLLSLGTYALTTHSIWFISTLAGALFPDIDITSKGQHLFLKLGVICVLLCLIFQAYIPLVLLLIFFLVPVFIPHRSLFHDLTFICMIVAVVMLVLLFFAQAKAMLIISSCLFFLLGVLSHLILDKGFKKTFH